MVAMIQSSRTSLPLRLSLQQKQEVDVHAWRTFISAAERNWYCRSADKSDTRFFCAVCFVMTFNRLELIVDGYMLTLLKLNAFLCIVSAVWILIITWVIVFRIFSFARHGHALPIVPKNLKQVPNFSLLQWKLANSLPVSDAPVAVASFFACSLLYS